MTHYLGIITAYGAVAILAWLLALLYPRLIPAAGEYAVDARWRKAGLFLLALAVAIGLSRLRAQGWLLADGNVWLSAVNQLLVIVPFLVFILYMRSRAAALIPDRHILRSLAVGAMLAIPALLAFYSSVDGWQTIPALLDALTLGDTAAIALRSLLRCLVVGAFLALVAGGWSGRTALALAAIAIAATQIPSLLDGGFSAEWLVVLIAHVALVVGLLSAILVTRNIVWFWPVLVALNLLQFHTF
ncbi:hypothetical protein [Aurantiacibacter hainanensis]|uniref:hypothetical protein n=1 Tax=Aurantiacibacter hainanensis TaxID=3076114 RepID=UPI0030C7671B